MDDLMKGEVIQFHQLRKKEIFNKDGNHIYYKIRDELIKRKKEKEKCGWLAIFGLSLGVIPLGVLFTVRESNMSQLGEVMTNPFVWLGILILAVSYCYYLIYYKKAEEKYDSLKDELRMRIWNDFFFYEEKDAFLKETEEKFGINLYWK